MKFPKFVGNEPCTELGPEIYCASPEGVTRPYTGIEVMRAACARCDMLAECREWGVHHEGSEGGFWGGLSPTERAAERKRRNIVLVNPTAYMFPAEQREAS